jgi:hypothetical protein
MSKINLHEMFEKLINRYDENEMCSLAWKKFGVGKENGAYKIGFIDASFAKSEEIKAALNDLQGKVDVLVNCLEILDARHEPHTFYYDNVLYNSSELISKAIAEFKKDPS